METCSNNWSQDFYAICLSLDIVDKFENREIILFENVKDNILRQASEQWNTNVNSKPKLRTYKTLKSSIQPELYVTCHLSRIKRSLTAQQRAGILPLNIELGRFRNIKLEDRICSLCHPNVIEDEFHFILQCPLFE